jgi:hypothetical protein
MLLEKRKQLNKTILYPKIYGVKDRVKIMNNVEVFLWKKGAFML